MSNPSRQPLHLLGLGVEPDARQTHAQLGPKGAHLATIARVGLRLPPTLIVTPDATRDLATGALTPAALRVSIDAALDAIAAATQRRFGDPATPLLLILRHGRALDPERGASLMPAIGLDASTLLGLASAGAENALALERLFCRHVERFAVRVMGSASTSFEHQREALRAERGVWRDADLDLDTMRVLRARLLATFEQVAGRPFPDAQGQLDLAIERLVERLRATDSQTPVSLVLQAQVLGELGDGSGVGVAFSHSRKGVRGLSGEFLAGGDGEALEQSLEIPSPLAGDHPQCLAGRHPVAFAMLREGVERLAGALRDMVEVRFAVDAGRLWFLGVRPAPRSASVAVKVAVDHVDAGVISPDEALRRVSPRQLRALLHPTLVTGAVGGVIARGLPASPGVASGQVAFNVDDVARLIAQGKSALLVQHDTHPEDIRGLQSAAGILIATGGMTSHAAVIARGLGKPCVVGCRELRIDPRGGAGRISTHVLSRESMLTINGGTGEVLGGAAAFNEPRTPPELERLLGWADERRRLGVWVNIDRASDARLARQLGATGVGLCRSEHLFFESDHIHEIQTLLLAETRADERRVLTRLGDLQRQRFESILAEMDDLPVVFRLLDPPLHEFLPRTDVEMEALAERLGLGLDEIRVRVRNRQESNPMLGYRGVRLGMVRPGIYEMQARAIFEAADARRRAGGTPRPQIMLPLVCAAAEIRAMRELLDDMARAVFGAHPIDWQLGAMIELPRACLIAGELAEHVDFFSFGTNDLTQMTFGISRDDTTQFMTRYLERGVFPRDPFVTIDVDSVGYLMALAIEGGRRVNPALTLGLCGEHGGDPESIAFFHSLGLDYVSCSPYRVPIARLVGAHAAINASSQGGPPE